MPPNPFRRQPNINDMMYPKGHNQPRQVWGAVMNVYKAPVTTPPVTPSPTPTQTQSGTPNPTATPTNTPTQTQTGTPQVTPTQTLTPTNTGTPTNTPTPSVTPTFTTTPTNTITPTNTTTPTPTIAAGTSQANAYLTAVVNAGGTGITSTVSAATRTLFTSLVSNNLYNRIVAMYPMLGGNSAGCKFNAINPLDTNAAYRLTFNGGWTYSSSGATSNGINAYANTYLSGGTITPNNNHASVYINQHTSTFDGRTLIGEQTSGKFFGISYGGDGNSYYYYGLETDGIAVSSVFTTGYSVITTTGSSFQNLYRNNSLIKGNSGATTGNTVHEVLIAALNQDGSISQETGSRFAFVSMGSGFTTSEITTLSTIINTYQTSLGRNTY